MRYEKVTDITFIVIVTEFELFYDIVDKWQLLPRSSSWYALFFVSHPGKQYILLLYRLACCTLSILFTHSITDYPLSFLYFYLF